MFLTSPQHGQCHSDQSSFIAEKNYTCKTWDEDTVAKFLASCSMFYDCFCHKAALTGFWPVRGSELWIKQTEKQLRYISASYEVLRATTQNNIIIPLEIMTRYLRETWTKWQYRFVYTLSCQNTQFTIFTYSTKEKDLWGMKDSRVSKLSSVL